MLQRTPPKQLEHLIGINDVRIAAELGLSLSYFFACWELPALAWQQPIIPDAIFGTEGQAIALEFDRGQENLRYFLSSKISVYNRGLPGFPLFRLLIVTDRQARLQSLARAIGKGGGPSGVRLTRLDLIQRHTLREPICFESSLAREVTLL